MPFPNPNVSKSSFTFRDAKGNTAQMRVFLTDPAATGANDDYVVITNGIADALEAMSNAALQSISGWGYRVGTAQYGGTGAYQPVEQKAVFVFQDSGGILHRYAVASPKVALFEADGQTINPAQTQSAAFIAAMLANSNGVGVGSKDGLLLTNFMGGIWQGRKLHRKTNILVLTPALTPGIPAE